MIEMSINVEATCEAMAILQDTNEYRRLRLDILNDVRNLPELARMADLNRELTVKLSQVDRLQRELQHTLAKQQAKMRQMEEQYGPVVKRL